MTKKKVESGEFEYTSDNGDDETPIVCQVCGGEWERVEEVPRLSQYKKIVCRWCSRGSMSAKELKKWIDYRNKTRAKKALLQTG